MHSLARPGTRASIQSHYVCLTCRLKSSQTRTRARIDSEDGSPSGQKSVEVRGVSVKDAMVHGATLQVSKKLREGPPIRTIHLSNSAPEPTARRPRLLDSTPEPPIRRIQHFDVSPEPHLRRVKKSWLKSTAAPENDSPLETNFSTVQTIAQSQDGQSALRIREIESASTKIDRANPHIQKYGVASAKLKKHYAMGRMKGHANRLDEQTAGSYIRKQGGEAFYAKIQKEVDDGRRDSLLSVIDAHQMSASGIEVDPAEVDRAIVDGMWKDHGIEPHRAFAGQPEDRESDDAVREQVLQKYAAPGSYISSQRKSRVMRGRVSYSQQGPIRADAPMISTKPSSHASVGVYPTSTLLSARRFDRSVDTSAVTTPLRSYNRPFHSSPSISQQATAATTIDEVPPPPDMQYPVKQGDIRTRLRKWQELHGNQDADNELDAAFESDPNIGETSNTFTRLPDISTALRTSAIDQEEERQAEAHFMSSEPGEIDSVFDTRTLQMGDLVELEFPNQDRESVIAVFVRRTTIREAQFFTMNGRWVFALDRLIPYSIPGWVSPKLVEPILQHLPDPADMKEREVVMDKAYMVDMSVPREVAAPLVSRMVQFWSESKEIYRRNASALDNAHNILAHESDLRYGSLISAATTLLQTPADKLPVTALFTVRSALTRAGFAFSIDRRSHRLTGYLQIRSKEQVKMVNYVRSWIRDWQDDLAKRAALQNEGNFQALERLEAPRTAKHVYSFVEKARQIVLQSRKDRQPTMSGVISPSKARYPITPDKSCIKVTTDLQFTDEETEIVRFCEAWTCSRLFLGLPRLQALPPLLLHAIGLYSDYALDSFTGWMFLQELGTVMPYDNRVRFDQHLLLPSSQHSKPLQNLMSSLMTMKDKPNFSDSMKGLRHDWGSMPVYCIDEASAQEIDDGLSVERAGPDQWWAHIHVANPTAFIERDHPLAKMARHMGETLYMPERTYTMLPRWATTGYFSLAKNRPCLTFSVKLDAEGRTLDYKITPGTVRNVIRLTKAEVLQLLGMSEDAEQSPTLTLTVGGKVPPRRTRQSSMAQVGYEQIQELKILHMLGQKRSDLRKAKGGLFYFGDPPELEVWQYHAAPGLSWDHPHRRGRRSVEGDPIIQMQTRGLRNPFSSASSAAHILVQEMMLAAAEVAGKWCAERQIPAIFRGTLRRPGMPDPDAYLRQVLEPAAKESPDGAWPMHLGQHYLLLLGVGAIRTRPIKHQTLGMDHFCKATSPLRRYGDMILHWQIEAALREEAKQGTSLITHNPNASRRFLPFSRAVLETIVVGLQPRERMITDAKKSANDFWSAMLMFRAHHYGECELPFATPAYPDKPKMRVWISGGMEEFASGNAVGTNIELNLNVSMKATENFGLEPAQRGDVWEAEIDHVNVRLRTLQCRPLRLVERSVSAPASWRRA